MTSAISACSGKHKSRLFIGEGNFTSVEALVKKQKTSHPSLGSSITATEIDLGCLERTKKRIDSLRKKGITIPPVSVDGTQIHQFFHKKRFERIHWNCPFLGSTYEDRKQLKNVVLPHFFASASKLQKPDDRIHVTLAQEVDFNPHLNRLPFRYKRQAQYGIVKAATESRYRLIRKRRFDSKRYPGYSHAQTGKDKECPGEKREFVFEKVKPEEFSKKPKSSLNRLDAQFLMDPSKKLYDIKSFKEIDGDQYYYECSTDEDSSDYESVKK